MGICTAISYRASLLILQNAEVCGKTPGQEREPKLLRLASILNDSKGSL